MYSSGSSTMRPVGTVATHSCDSGFGFTPNVGNTQRTCQSNGLWSGSSPICESRQSFTTIHSYGFGGCIICSLIQYLAQNYKSLLCTVSCPVLPVLANGMITYNSGSSDVRPVGTVATHSCNPGFVLNRGNEQRTCQSTLLWSGSAPFCERRQSFTTTV